MRTISVGKRRYPVRYYLKPLKVKLWKVEGDRLRPCRAIAAGFISNQVHCPWRNIRGWRPVLLWQAQ